MKERATKVLVIDDDASVLHALGLFLKEEGYDVTTAEGYDGRLKGVKKSNLPDLIVLDILLSDENGCAIARGLKKDAATADIPIIMVSAHPGGQKMAEESGADAYLGKPFEIDHLLDTIDRLGKEPRSIAAS